MFPDGAETDDVVAVVTALVALDVAASGEVELGRAARVVRRVRGWLDAFEAEVAHRSDELERDGRDRAPSRC